MKASPLAAYRVPCCGNESGAAALEAALYAFAVIVPMIWLTWYVWSVGTMKDNAISAARHGAVRDSMEGWCHWGDARDETGRPRSKSETDAKQYIAYVPALVSGTTVLQSPQPDGERLQTKASIQSDMPILDLQQLGETGADTALGRLIIQYRNPRLYASSQPKNTSFRLPIVDLIGDLLPANKGPSHTIAQAEWAVFLGLVAVADAKAAAQVGDVDRPMF